MFNRIAMCMDAQVPRAQEAQERPMCMDAQVPRAQEAQERPMCMDAQVPREAGCRERPMNIIHMPLKVFVITNQMLDNCSCIVLTTAIHGLVPIPSLPNTSLATFNPACGTSFVLREAS